MKYKTKVLRSHELSEEETKSVLDMARKNLIKVGDCMEWGVTRASGNRHRQLLRVGEDGTRYVVRTLDVLVHEAGIDVSTNGVYTPTCGNKRCMNPEHMRMGRGWSKYDNEGSELYEYDKALAIRMIQNGWPTLDVAETTSTQMYEIVTKDGVGLSGDAIERTPLSYKELHQLAETIRVIKNKPMHAAELAENARIEYERLLVNGSAVSALRRRMTNTKSIETVLWFLTLLGRGYSVKRACDEIGKLPVYGTLLLGACYG